ncbi:hypothetical protein BDZ91DRAFT_763643 [Kalaharituber pfeilii]|nr:hypothetical protein BDZ91DRAFT_763643 [Kalaharituber pfeilii]
MRKRGRQRQTLCLYQYMGWDGGGQEQGLGLQPHRRGQKDAQGFWGLGDHFKLSKLIDDEQIFMGWSVTDRIRKHRSAEAESPDSLIIKGYQQTNWWWTDDNLLDFYVVGVTVMGGILSFGVVVIGDMRAFSSLDARVAISD